MAENESEEKSARARATTAFGWLSGGLSGLLINMVLAINVGEGYPTTWTTFLFFLVGAFAGMALADRLGERGFKPLGIAAGVLLALVISIVVTTYLPAS